MSLATETTTEQEVAALAKALGHPARVAEIMTLAAAHPGLILGGNAYHGVAINDCCEQAESITRRV